MTGRPRPRVFSIPPGVPFLTTLADALFSDRLVPGFDGGGDPLALADVTVYLPTRRAARALRSIFAGRSQAGAAILPTIRALGEFDEELELLEAPEPALLDLAPPISSRDRTLLLAPLVQRWKGRLPAHFAMLYGEPVVVPASAADAVWLARDLARLMDEMETEGADWAKLAGLVEGDLAAWWQVTLEFLDIVSSHWPEILRSIDRSNPAAHRNAMIRAEAARLRARPPRGPVIAAGSTGSIPATAELLSVISILDKGAVVLPGLDTLLDDTAWAEVGEIADRPANCGHPQFGLRKLLGRLGMLRADVEEIGAPQGTLAARRRLVSEALRPAATTDAWAALGQAGKAGPATVEGIALVEAASERDEALAIAVALRHALGAGRKRTALVTGDRSLARRVAAELLRFGIKVDDSAGQPLSRAPAAVLMWLLVEAALRPGDPVALLSLLKHPLFSLGMGRADVRSAAETIELVALRGGSGRPDLAGLAEAFDERLSELGRDRHAPSWLVYVGEEGCAKARAVTVRLRECAAPLVRLRGVAHASLPAIAHATVEALEAVGATADDGLATLYAGNAGARLGEFLRGLMASDTALEFGASEWPDILAALIAPEAVTPPQGADSRVAIWGALEARLQEVDLLVIGGLNEGTWPHKAEADRFMSRFMKAGLELEPPERRIGLAAHDFMMALGAPEIVLTRSVRAGDAPAVASRWLQRLETVAGAEAVLAMRRRGADFTAWAALLDRGKDVAFARRPEPKPPLAVRPKRFSVTEIETLRRDPYAVYARRVLRLEPVEPLLADPGAAERGTLFHEALHRFVRAVPDPHAPDAQAKLLAIGRALFAGMRLPDDVAAVWWPRFEAMAAGVVAFERRRSADVVARHSEIAAGPVPVGGTGVVLSGRADRIDLRADGTADILDYKTGSGPSKAQANTLLAPQLALEGALLRRGAFAAAGARDPADLVFVRLKTDGEVKPESILRYQDRDYTAPDLSEEAWRRLEELLEFYADPASGYRSRALPFREGDLGGDYDHLARVAEWSAGADGEEAA